MDRYILHPPLLLLPLAKLKINPSTPVHNNAVLYVLELKIVNLLTNRVVEPGIISSIISARYQETSL